MKWIMFHLIRKSKAMLMHFSGWKWGSMGLWKVGILLQHYIAS